jgi:hypothetical protein
MRPKRKSSSLPAASGNAGEGWLAPFRVWVWSPKPPGRNPSLRQRGRSNARLDIFAGGFAVWPNRMEQRLFHWDHAEYTWPVVVMEAHTRVRWRDLRMDDPGLLSSTGLLFDVSGEIARCVIRRREERWVREALERAGLMVINVSHPGGEAPHRVPHLQLGPYASSVPASIVED